MNRTRTPARLLTAAVLVLAGLSPVVLAGSAQGAARVTVTNTDGGSTASASGPTTLAVSGRGFQAVKGGAGGIYVAFGWVSDPTGGSWAPSRGGSSGTDYRYVPDSRDASNAGHQRFVAFPGAETASSANDVMSGSGGWSVTVSVPGPRFTSVDASGSSVEVDCTQVTCGVITIGAHGITNANNETFTPVTFSGTASGGSASAGSETDGGSAAATAVPTEAATVAPKPAGKPKVAVDRSTAAVGRVLAFTGSGFTPGEQVVAVLDDGVAAVGPLGAGASGEIAGVLQLPAGIEPGTHVLRLTGAASGAAPEIAFAVAPATVETEVTETAAADTGPTTASWLFLAAGAALLLGALVVAVLRVRRSRRPRLQAGAH
ncbi:hypothetical protein CLV56_2741 [Mumia flava]|uniref:Htaa protein n=1 Tax=Mumia flava TaxID=1348852 RepID=A0A0B2BIA9_9ACTN|nr:hypothetical protein [Mumia flava]PJJ58490.1 hypothetical protein CLV56_2741 [Mumia flava]